MRLALLSLLLALPAATAIPDVIPGLKRTPDIYGYRVVARYHHDSNAFTQGLLFHDGMLYESTGLYGASELRKVDPDSGRVLARRRLSSRLFGEGITLLNGRIYQLTWKAQRGFIYDADSLNPLGQFEYRGEGWGLANDGARLIMSNGTPLLRWLDAQNFRTVRQVQVTAAGLPVAGLNELEYIDGELYANVYPDNRIARIDPATGEVRAWLELPGLWGAQAMMPKKRVLNGIAYDADNQRLLVTGKHWPELFHIELVPFDGNALVTAR